MRKQDLERRKKSQDREQQRRLKADRRRADDEKRRLPLAQDQRTAAVRALVRKAIDDRTRGRDDEPLLPAIAAAAAAEAVRPALEAKFAEEPRPACKKGCSFCCNMHVAVTIPELLVALELVRRTQSVAQREALAKKASEAAKAVRGKTVLEYPIQPCAFLAEDGSCSVYVARPLACRGTHSFDVDACRRVYEANVDEVTDRRPSIVALADGATDALRDALAALQLDAAAYELNQALDIALNDPTSTARWRRGERAFDAARVLVSETDLLAMKRTVVTR
jgi:Fe-S-cluster containining protein